MQLPEQFAQRMREEFGGEFDSYLASLDKKSRPSLRINQSKIDVKAFLELSGLETDPIPWIPNGVRYPEEFPASHHPYYYAGLYYLQEASAMTPAAVLPVQPGDRVLDLCAAPGGKATELAAKTGPSGMLLANDISVSRARALLKNLEVQGFGHILVTGEDPVNLVDIYPEFFDKILLDAPCSGEGMVQKDASMLKSWMEKGPDYYAPIQKTLIRQAYSMLKPGGQMVYSTCTFSKMENEEVIACLLSEEPEAEVLPLTISYEGFVAGDASIHPTLDRTAHIYPHKMEGAGHYVALLRKREREGAFEGRKTYAPVGSKKMPKEAVEFMQKVKKNWAGGTFYTVKDQIYYLPEGLRFPEKLRYLRTGLWLGTLKNGRFTPSQALAMHLKEEEFTDCVTLKAGDDRVIRYLKGESLEIPEFAKQKGDVLVTVDGYPLGFGKADKGRLKNKYYPGWRMQ